MYVGAWEMFQWLKHLVNKQDGQSLDPQNLFKEWVGMVTFNSNLGRKKQGIPEKPASQPNRLTM